MAASRATTNQVVALGQMLASEAENADVHLEHFAEIKGENGRVAAELMLK